MQISQLMSKDFAYIGQRESLHHAAELMRDKDIGILPVLEENQVVGTVTDRDIVVRGLAEGKDVQTPVSDIMSRGVKTKYADEEVEQAAEMMQHERVRRIVILDRDERCVGVLSAGDIATGSGDRRLGGEVLEGVSQPGS